MCQDRVGGLENAHDDEFSGDRPLITTTIYLYLNHPSYTLEACTKTNMNLERSVVLLGYLL